MTGAPLLDVRAASAGHGDRDVIHSIDVQVAPQEVVCLLGANGAGKTTLLRALSGTLRRTRGEVRLGDVPLQRRPVHARVAAGLVHVPEGRASLIPSLTVAEHLTLAERSLRRVGGTSRADVLELFPVLAQRLGQQAGTMSGGQQQQLAIALGVLLAPVCLLVDEPSAGLSPIMVDEVADLLLRLRAAGVAMLVAEQRVDIALDLCERAYVLEGGRIVDAGSPRQLSESGSLAASYLGVADGPIGAHDPRHEEDPA